MVQDLNARNVKTAFEQFADWAGSAKEAARMLEISTSYYQNLRNHPEGLGYSSFVKHLEKMKDLGFSPVFEESKKAVVKMVVECEELDELKSQLDILGYKIVIMPKEQ